MRWCFLVVLAGCWPEGECLEHLLTTACDKRQECELYDEHRTYDDCMAGTLDPQVLVCLRSGTMEVYRECFDQIVSAPCEEAEAAIAPCLRWCGPC